MKPFLGILGLQVKRNSTLFHHKFYLIPPFLARLDTESACISENTATDLTKAILYFIYIYYHKHPNITKKVKIYKWSYYGNQTQVNVKFHPEE